MKRIIILYFLAVVLSARAPLYACVAPSPGHERLESIAIFDGVVTEIEINGENNHAIIVAKVSVTSVYKGDIAKTVQIKSWADVDKFCGYPGRSELLDSFNSKKKYTFFVEKNLDSLDLRSNLKIYPWKTEMEWKDIERAAKAATEAQKDRSRRDKEASDAWKAAHPPPRVSRSNCFMEVASIIVIDKPCQVREYFDGSIQLGGENPNTTFALVNAINESKGKANGLWNGPERGSIAHKSLGLMLKRDNCWINDQARICWN